MRTTPRRAATVIGIVALSMPGATLFAQRATPPQRGSPPGQDTPYILVTAFRAPTKQLAVEGADELRDRLRSEHSAKELFVLTKTGVEGTLTASGYPVDSALNVSDLMELAKTMRGEYVTDVTLKKTGVGNAVRLEARLLMKTGQQTIAQPLPAVDGKDVGDAVKQVEKSITEALKQIPMYKECIAALRAGKWDDAAVKARGGIVAYSNSAWSRVCLLNAYASGKTAPPDSIINVGNQILAVDSASMLALVNLADAYKAKGDRTKANELYLRIYRLDPSNQGVVRALIKELASSDPEKALPLIAALLADLPGDADLIKDRWLIQLKLGQFKAAIATGEELEKVDTATAGSLDFFNRQIGAAQNDSNNAKIAELAGRAAQKFPKDVSFPNIQAQTLRKMGQLPQAMEAARRASSIDPKNANAWLFTVVLAMDMGQPDTAMALGKQAIAAGVEKTQIAQVLVNSLSPIVSKAKASNARADWLEALKASQDLDAFAPSPHTKYFIGVASFSIAVDALQQVQELQKKPATFAQGCEQLKIVEDNFATASINMPAGGSVDKDAAAQVLGTVNEYSKYIPPLKTAMKCK